MSARDVAISVEGLGKRYRIGAIQHEGSRYKYKTLRDVLAGTASGLGRRVLSPFRGARRPAAQENEIWALKDISFEVKAGDAVGIIGRNGAGKSTLLKVLSRITEPTEGFVRIQGRVGSLLEVGTGFHPELTGRENIYLNGAIIGMRRFEIERKFDEIVAFAEVERFLNTPVKHFSSGMYLRLAFAVAAHLEPEILLVDEVLAVGDAAFQKKCLGKMDDVRKQGRTVLFVSHNMNAVEELCNVAVLLDRGRNQQMSRDVRQIITHYLFGPDADSSASEWINPGHEFANPWFQPLRFFVCDARGQRLNMPLSNDTEAWVQLEGKIETPDPALTVGYAIFTDSGQALYWSYQTDGIESTWPVLKPGINILRGRLPRRTLNEGQYRIELIGGLHFRQWLFEPGVRAPSIHIGIQGGLSDSPYFMAKRPGALAPIMEWTVPQ